MRVIGWDAKIVAEVLLFGYEFLVDVLCATLAEGMILVGLGFHVVNVLSIQDTCMSLHL